jgi:hypothetical protein
MLLVIVAFVFGFEFNFGGGRKLEIFMLLGIPPFLGEEED